MAKIKIDDGLLAKAKQVSESEGYSNIDEFVAHCIEIELKRHQSDEAEDQVSDQLRGLGYIE